MNKNIVTRVIFLILIIINCIVIFIFSSQNGEKSSNVSGSFVKQIIEILPGTENLSKSEKEQLTENLQFVVRKGAHFSIYTLLGFFTMGFMNTFNISARRKILFAFIFGLLYAITDEIHQLFSSGRSAKIMDVGIDSLGVIFGILIISLIIYLINRKNSKPKRIITN